MAETKQHRAPRVSLEPNVAKIIDAICFIISEAMERKLGAFSQYDIVKALFIADKYHLNTYGRPVTFDNYVAMKHGPVPTLAYDLLKQTSRVMQRHNITVLPWKRIKQDSYFLYSLKRPYQDKDILSESDRQALAGALLFIKRLTFGQIRALTHNDPAYIEAWDDEGAGKRQEMSLGMFFDSPDFEAAERVAFLSRHT